MRGPVARVAVLAVLAAMSAIGALGGVVHAQERAASGDSVTSAAAWGDPATTALVTRAIARRGQQLADTTLRDYAADAQGFLAFLAQLGEGFPEPPRVVQSEQLALRIAWWAPDSSSQQLVGRRDTTLLPADVGYYRDRYGVVLDNLPDRIRLGDGNDVRDIPHPLSAGAERLYEYAPGDTLRIRLPDREVAVTEVRFRPRDADAARAVGSVYLDRTSAAVVRLSLTFTRGAIRDRRIETLVLTLENALVAGRWWLPRRQEVEVARRSTWLDVPARGIVRGSWLIDGYVVNEGVSPLAKILPRWSSVSADSLARYAFDARIVDVLPPSMRVASDDDVAAARARAEDAVRAAALARPTRAALSGRGVSDLVRHSRTEGLAVGLGVATRFGPALRLGVRGRYGVDDREVKGRVTLERVPALGGAPTVSVFAERDYRDVAAPERAGVTNSLASLLFGSDYTTQVDTWSAGLAWRPGAGTTLLTAAWRDERPLAVVARPRHDGYAPALGTWRVRGPVLRFETRTGGVLGDADRWDLRVRVEGATGTQVEEPVRLASPGDPPVGGVLPDVVPPEDMIVNGPRRSTAVTVEATGEWSRRLANDRAIALAWRAGLVAGTDVPPHWQLFAGGPWSAAGYGFSAFRGRRLASLRASWRTPVPFVSVPLAKYGRTPSTATFEPYAQLLAVDGVDWWAVETGAARVAGAHPSAGVAVLLFWDLLRVDVARGLRDGRWRFAIDVDRGFWGIL